MSTFRHYAENKLGAQPYIPDPGDFVDQPFITALASFEALAARSRDMTNAQGMRLRFECGYVRSMSPNAFAAIYDGAHVIGVNQALLVTIIEFALYVFTQADQFPQIGDAAGEDSPGPAFGAAPGILLLDKTLRGEAMNARKDAHRVPKDAARHIAAIYLAMLMIRFVWMHELAHCANGHVLLLRDMNLDAALNEVPGPSMLVGFKKAALETAPDARQRVLHALELDADECALRTAARIQLWGGENIEGIARLDPRTRMAMCLLGAYLMTWLFDEYQRFANTVHDRTHPFPKDRLANLVRYASTEIGEGIDGYAALHAAICASFNRLALKIPNMHRIDPETATYSPVRYDADLIARLAPLRFVPVTPETSG